MVTPVKGWPSGAYPGVKSQTPSGASQQLFLRLPLKGLPGPQPSPCMCPCMQGWAGQAKGGVFIQGWLKPARPR